MRLTFRAVAVAIGLLFPVVGSGAATAGQIFVSAVSLGNGHQVSSIAGGTVASPQSYHAGQFTLTANPGNSDNAAGRYDIFAWCVDILHSISLGTTRLVYEEGSLSTAGYGGPVLSAQQIARVGWLAAYGNAKLADGPDSLLSAAVQTAIWNVANGSSYVGGNAQLGTAVANLMALLPANPTGFVMTTLLPVAQGDGTFSQMLVTASMAPVPEPGTLALIGVGLAGLVAVRRRARATRA